MLEDDSKEFHGSIVEGTHTVGLCGIEVDAVSRIKHECLLADGQFEMTLGDEVELLSLVGVGMQRMIIWLRLDSHHKGVGSTTAESAGKTLSGGESQRVNLVTALGSSLVGSMYILDEPSIGLHPRDTARLIKVLKDLRDIGNTVIVVEHDEDIMRASDLLVDMGPGAGCNGGEVVYYGRLSSGQKSADNDKSLTLSYLNGSRPRYTRTRRSSPLPNGSSMISQNSWKS